MSRARAGVIVASPPLTHRARVTRRARVVPPPEPVMTTQVDPMHCPRCDASLDYVGTKRFHEGTRWGILGEIGELFTNREHFDVYVCPRCGRVELFVDGIGEEFRPH